MRERPIGILAARLLGVELVLVGLALIAVLVQFRQKIARIFTKLSEPLGLVCGLDELCQASEALGSWPLLAIVVWFFALVAYSVYQSAVFRRCVLEAVILAASFSGALLLYLASEAHAWDYRQILAGLALLSLAAFIAFFTIERTRRNPAGSNPATQPRTHSHPALLPANWLLFFAVLGAGAISSGGNARPEIGPLVSSQPNEIQRAMATNSSFSSLENTSLANGKPIVCDRDAYNCPAYSGPYQKKRLESCEDVHRVWRACGTDVHGLDDDGDGYPCEKECGRSR